MVTNECRCIEKPAPPSSGLSCFECQICGKYFCNYDRDKAKGDCEYHVSTHSQCEVGLIDTELTIESSKDKVLLGELEVDISGKLIRKDTGAGLGYKMIHLYRKKPSEESLEFYYELGNYPNGQYIFRVMGIWDEEGIYQFQTRFEGDEEFSGCKSPILEIECYVPTPEEVPTSLSIKADPKEVIIPAETRISGKLIRTDTGAGILKPIRLFRKRPDEGSFNLHGLTSSDHNGNYFFDPNLEIEGISKSGSKK